MATTPLRLPDSSFNLPPRLELVEVDDHRVVLLNGHPIGQYRRDERGTERVLMTQLAEVLPLRDAEIAQIFGLHAVSLSRFRSRARQGGAAALMPLRPGPQKPSKLTPQMEARIVRLHEEEQLSSRAIARRLSRGRRKVSHTLVANVLRAHRAAPTAQPLPLEAEPGDRLAEQPAARDRSLQPGARRRSRYAGALMLYAGLGRLDLWGAFRALGARVGPARRFGWMQTVAAIVLCFALRFRSIEDLKNALRKELGVILGEVSAPGVPTLRLKLKRLTESVDPSALARQLFERYVALEPVWEGLYYVDGHFCPYYGKHPTPQGWSARRRLAIKGHTDAYVHDARGRALFFVSRPLNDSLVRAIPSMVEQIRQVHGSGAFTLVFDRGGYSGKLFRWLTEQGIAYITYLKGRKARRRYPVECFHRGWFFFKDKRHVYRLYEKQTRVDRAGRVRTIVWLDDEEEQIPVLTNLGRSVKAAKVVHCLRLRWRQENSLKYLRQHYAIDQIIQYGAEEQAEEQLVANPKRKRLRGRVREVRAEIESLEAELGRALDRNQERVRRTTRGLKIAHGKLRRRLELKRQVLGRLENRLRHTPAVVPPSELERAPRRALLREERRLMVNTIKLAAYNAERVLALQFNRHYQQAKDVFSVFRALFHLPGTVRRRSKDHLEIQLDRPEPDKVARALESFAEELNAEQARLFGVGPVLEFRVSR